MTERWTIQHIENLLKTGKIKGYTLPAKAKKPGGRKVSKIFAKPAHPQKQWMSEQLLAWCQERGFVLHEEYNFNPLRRWRADWCIPELKILIEYEGLTAGKSGHTTSEGYTGNAEKYNSAQALGWKVIRFTYLNYTNLITELNKYV